LPEIGVLEERAIVIQANKRLVTVDEKVPFKEAHKENEYGWGVRKNAQDKKSG
jgi:hypothetical protein